MDAIRPLTMCPVGPGSPKLQWSLRQDCSAAKVPLSEGVLLSQSISRTLAQTRPVALRLPVHRVCKW
jgi:hypothetical protein